MKSLRDLLGWDPTATGLAKTGQLYLDNNATSPIAPIVVEAMTSCWQTRLGNASSQHQTGQASARTLQQSRETLLKSLGGDTTRFPSDRLIFTSGGTEANNLALFGLVSQNSGNIVISGIEHPSILEAAKRLQARGLELRVVSAKSNGRVEPDDVADMMDSETRLVSTMLANNETGVIQPVADIAAVCRERGVPCHTDAVQAVGKIPVSFQELGVDALTFTPHKFHGPLGIGGLLVGASINLEPMLWGGFQQQGERPGTDNVALAVGAATALAWYLDNQPENARNLAALRDRFESRITAEISDAIILGAESSRLPQTSCIAFPGIDRQALVLAADMAGVACATGSACASGSSEPSPVLAAMGLDSALINTAIRFSFGVFNQPDEADEAANRISLIHGKLRQRATA